MELMIKILFSDANKIKSLSIIHAVMTRRNVGSTNELYIFCKPDDSYCGRHLVGIMERLEK